MRVLRLWIVLFVVVGGVFAGEVEKISVLTHADAAVVLSKYFGFFDRYVSPDATVGACVSFLNDTGIEFAVMDVITEKEFIIKDCARVTGQISLVFSGEAKYLGGKVMLPNEFSSWEEFCLMNDVHYEDIYRSVTKMLHAAEAIK